MVNGESTDGCAGKEEIRSSSEEASERGGKNDAGIWQKLGDNYLE